MDGDPWVRERYPNYLPSHEIRELKIGTCRDCDRPNQQLDKEFRVCIQVVTSRSNAAVGYRRPQRCLNLKARKEGTNVGSREHPGEVQGFGDGQEVSDGSGD